MLTTLTVIASAAALWLSVLSLRRARLLDDFLDAKRVALVLDYYGQMSAWGVAAADRNLSLRRIDRALDGLVRRGYAYRLGAPAHAEVEYGITQAGEVWLREALAP